MGCVAGYVRVLERFWFVFATLWLAVLVWGVVEGPKFLSSTDNMIQVTSGTFSTQQTKTSTKSDVALNLSMFDSICFT